jgi:DNA invertase Pin-like site-specific DNA recombinase
VNAVIYSRFSTDRQNESSIADQVRVCREYAERQGWTVSEAYEDQGISGAALGNRPGVLRLQEAALARRLDVVLVTDLSRLSRSQGDLSKMIDRLVAKGVRVIGVQDGYDSARRGHKLQAGLSGIIGEALGDGEGPHVCRARKPCEGGAGDRR